jgi:type IX secretion system PorP/SprF family membrane protein
MQKLLLRCVVPVLCVLFFTKSNAQDLHFSQFQNSPLNHNPALTGIFNGDQRFVGNYRRQWFDVPVDYLTFSGSYDMKFRADGAKSFWSAGAVFNYDRAGDARLATAYLGLNASYTFGFTPGVLLTAGVTVGGGQKSLRTTELLWGNYWDGNGVDVNRPSGEPNLGDSKFYGDLGAGLNLRLQSSSRTRLDIGAGAFHLNKPNNTFYNDESVELPIRAAFQFNGSVELAPILDLKANALYHIAGPFQEIVVSALINFHISRKRAREVQFAVGAAWRVDDSIIPMVEIAYDGWRAAFSYDVNTSIFEEATGGRGGPEFSLIYIIKKVRPLDDSKLCRIF